jgi:hypothetical protein
LSLDLRRSAKWGSFARLFGRRTQTGVPHKYLQAIVRTTTDGSLQVPVAVVSKQYTLVQHRDLAAALQDAVITHIENSSTLRCDVMLSEYGGRMKIRVHLPADIKPPDGDEIRPTLECLNSVDGSRPLQIYLGWFRFICENGLVVGVEFARLRRRHVRSLQLPEVAQAVSDSIARLSRDAAILERWWNTPVSPANVRKWIDGPIAQRWGAEAAARVLNIAQTGHDCRVRVRRGMTPSRLPVQKGEPVPGSAPPNGNLYRLSQVLAVVAHRRREVEAVHDRVADIPVLMTFLELDNLTTNELQSTTVLAPMRTRGRPLTLSGMMPEADGQPNER